MRHFRDRTERAADGFLDCLGRPVTCEILPAAPSVTYSALSGPMVLPVVPCRPVTTQDGGGAHGWLCLSKT